MTSLLELMSVLYLKLEFLISERENLVGSQGPEIRSRSGAGVE